MTSELTTSGRRYGDKTASERHDGRRARLLEAGLDAFGTRGFAGTTIGQLCSAANVSTRNFYEHFPTREALLIALHDDINARALTAVGLAIADIAPDDLPGRARAGVTAYFRAMTEDRRAARIAVVESVGVSQEAEAHRATAMSSFAGVIQQEAERLAAAGLIPVRDFRLLSVALVGAVLGLINTWTTDPEWDPDAVNATAAELIALGLTREAV